MTEYGLFYFNKNKHWEEILDIAIYPCELYHSANYSNCKVKIAVFDKKKSNWRKILLNRADVAEHRKLLPILADYGLNVHSDNIKLISKFLVGTIAKNIEVLAEVTTTNLTGWHDDNAEFVYSNVAGKYDHIRSC